MGMAGAQGMVRRTLYAAGNQYEPFLGVAVAGGIIMTIGFIAFLINVLTTLGWTNIVSLVVPDRGVEEGASAVAAAQAQESY